MSFPTVITRASSAFPVSTLLALACLLTGCNSHGADPVAVATDIAEARCECTRQNAPSVARCVNQASHALHDATSRISDGAVKSAMVRAYEEAFRKCPWDDPSYYR